MTPSAEDSGRLLDVDDSHESVVARVNLYNVADAPLASYQSGFQRHYDVSDRKVSSGHRPFLAGGQRLKEAPLPEVPEEVELAVGSGTAGVDPRL